MVVVRHPLTLCLSLLFAVMLATTQVARANEKAQASVDLIEPLVVAGQLVLNADLTVALSDRMKQALSRGVPLTFAIELKIETPRWWWFDKTIVNTTLQRRLSFNPLTRSWRITTGDFAVAATTFEQAMGVLSTVRSWPVVPSDRFEPDQTYKGAIRISLNSDQLARPLQMDSARDAWVLSSPWRAFDFSIQRDTGASQ